MSRCSVAGMALVYGKPREWKSGGSPVGIATILRDVQRDLRKCGPCDASSLLAKYSLFQQDACEKTGGTVWSRE